MSAPMERSCDACCPAPISALTGCTHSSIVSAEQMTHRPRSLSTPLTHKRATNSQTHTNELTDEFDSLASTQTQTPTPIQTQIQTNSNSNSKAQLQLQTQLNPKFNSRTNLGSDLQILDRRHRRRELGDVQTGRVAIVQHEVVHASLSAMRTN